MNLPGFVHLCQFTLDPYNRDEEKRTCMAPAVWRNRMLGYHDTFFCEEHKRELEVFAWHGDWFPLPKP